MPKGNWLESQIATIDGRQVIGADGRVLGLVGPSGDLSVIYDIGLPGGQGFGVGVCPEILPRGMVGLYGYTDPASPNYGNYVTADGSVMVWIPAFYDKWGRSNNGLPINTCSIVGYMAFDSEAEAVSAGYALHRAFIDGGRKKSGFFIDKYQCSASASGIAVSVKNRPPLSSGEAHNPFSSLRGNQTNAYHGALGAAKTRGEKFAVATRFMHAALAELSYAHAQNSFGTTFCAWYDPYNNWPKGNNNNALRDSVDTSVLYVSEGYDNSALTGSGEPFAKTTHNGQQCGVADLNGSLFEVSLGFTSDGTNYFALLPSVEIANLTGGNTLASDAWGTTGLAANYENLGSTIDAFAGSATSKLFGNTNQVFSSAQVGSGWTARCLGIPLAGGVGGTNAFGNDSFGDNRTNECCLLSGGYWASTSGAGVWSIFSSHSRTSSSELVGFRSALYL